MESLQSSLFEAAAKGCVNSLQQLLINDSSILERDLVNSFNETPLHVAAMLGHIDFVKAVIDINPQLVYELNTQKRSPLHVAAAKGHDDVVTALLTVGQLTCLARDRNGLTPVHVAAMKGRDEAVKLLLEAQPDAARKLVYEDKETILHLCVKNRQLEALKLIVTTINEAEFLNSKDAHGNTALHLAVADNQVETTEFLVSMGAGTVEVNVQNQDVLIVPTRRIVTRLNTINNSFDEELRWVSDGLMVVAVLLASMIFQIATTPPGGVWQEDNFLINSEGKYVDPQGNRVLHPVDKENNTVPYPQQAGHAVLARNNPRAYKTLFVYNAVGFYACLAVILILMTGSKNDKVLKVVSYTIASIAFVAVGLSYANAVVGVTPKDIGLLFRGFNAVIPLIFYFSIIISFSVYKHWSSVKGIMKRLRAWRRPAEVDEDASETETGRILRTGVASSAVV